MQAVTNIIGWDIGGAHVKAALLTQGKVQQVVQVACPLWQGLDQLEFAIKQVFDAFELSEKQVQTHAITMTGELVDLFNNRQQGVKQIAQTMQNSLQGDCYYYQCSEGPNFVTPTNLDQHWASIASANWHASAQLVAQHCANGVLIDIGSTTTDVIVFSDGRVSNQGSTDAQRMRSQELLYTGVVRTPLMALGPSIAWQGHRYAIAAEYFATTADVYRLTNQLDPAADMAQSADGQPKTAEATMIRLARMLGHDLEDASATQWLALADAFKRKQVALISNTLQTQLDRLIQLQPALSEITLVSAGAGAFLLEEVIAQLGQKAHYPSMRIHSSAQLLCQPLAKPLVDDQIPLEQWASHCLPAVAVAILANQALCK